MGSKTVHIKNTNPEMNQRLSEITTVLTNHFQFFFLYESDTRTDKHSDLVDVASTRSRRGNAYNNLHNDNKL